MGFVFPRCSDALRLSPNSPDILTVRGLVLFLSGKLPQALQHMASALRLDPGHEAARRLRIRVKDVERLKEEGNVAFKSGRYEEAIEKYNKALDVSVSFLNGVSDTKFCRALVVKRKRAAVARSVQRCFRIGRLHC